MTQSEIDKGVIFALAHAFQADWDLRNLIFDHIKNRVANKAQAHDFEEDLILLFSDVLKRQ